MRNKHPVQCMNGKRRNKQLPNPIEKRTVAVGFLDI